MALILGIYIILLKHRHFFIVHYISIQKMQASPTSSTSTLDMQPSKKRFTPEDIFKYVNLAVTSILLFCVKGFLEFRSYCEMKGYYVFSMDSLIWIAVGFSFIFVSVSFISGHQVQLLPIHEKQNLSNHSPKI